MNRWTLSLVLLLGAACVDIQGPEMEVLAPSDVLAEIKIRSSAIMIAKGDSHQIGFDLIAMNEDTIPVDWKSIKWISSESQIVSVDSTGLVRGLEVSDGPILVATEYHHKYVTKVDTVRIYVTDGRIDADQIRLVALDSTRVGGFGVYGTPRVRVDLFKGGTLVEKGALIPIQVDAPAVADVDGEGGPSMEPVYRIRNEKYLIGKFWVRASLNLYGNEVNDSLSFTGLYNDLPIPAIGAVDIPPNYSEPIPVLDTLPLHLYQLCAAQLILNVSSEPVDIVFSDSTASATGCLLGPPDALNSFGLPVHGEIIGGNVINMPPFSIAFRKSNTPGVISFRIRKSATKEYIPWFIGHIKQVDVAD